MRRPTILALLLLPFPLVITLIASASPPDTTKSVRWVKKHLMVKPYESAAVADLNRDCHLDIVYGAYSFAAPDFAPQTFRPNHLAKEYLHANSDHIYDVDH